MGIPLVGVALLCNRWIVGFYTDSELLKELAFVPFVVMLLNYTFALPGYVYLNAVEASLSLYLTAEYLFVMLLALQSILYLKSKHY